MIFELKGVKMPKKTIEEEEKLEDEEESDRDEFQDDDFPEDDERTTSGDDEY